MESPETWSLLAASLYATRTRDAYEMWAFLVLQGLVKDRPGDRDAFLEIAEEEGSSDVTGPGVWYRVASRLAVAGMTHLQRDRPDPNGTIAKQRLEVVDSWQA